MKVTPVILAMRAVSAEFAFRIYTPLFYSIGIGLILLIGLSVWLVTLSAWWWLLLVPIIVLATLFGVAAIVIRFALIYLRPHQTSAQKATVRRFVDSLQKTSEAIQTPKFIILFRLVKDILFPGKSTYINELSDTAQSLRHEFKEVITLF